MRRMLFGALLLVPLCGLSGCKGATHESLAEEMMTLMNEFCDVMDGVTDNATAEAAKPKLEKIQERMKELGEKGKALGKLTKEEEEQLQKKYGPQMEKLLPRLFGQAMKMGKYPALKSLASGMGGGSPFGGPGGPGAPGK